MLTCYAKLRSLLPYHAAVYHIFPPHVNSQFIICIILNRIETNQGSRAVTRAAKTDAPHSRASIPAVGRNRLFPVNTKGRSSVHSTGDIVRFRGFLCFCCQIPSLPPPLHAPSPQAISQKFPSNVSRSIIFLLLFHYFSNLLTCSSLFRYTILISPRKERGNAEY